MTADAGQPLFLWVHYFGPHEPYVHHPELGDAPFGRRDVDRYDEEILRFCMKDGTPLLEEEEPKFVAMPSESLDEAVDDVWHDHGDDRGRRGPAGRGCGGHQEDRRDQDLIREDGL